MKEVMNKLFVFIFLLMNVCIAKSQHIITLSTGDTIIGVFSQAPARSIEYVNNGILVTYNFEKTTIMEDDIYERNYIWSYVGFGVNDTPTQPAIPYRKDSYTMPSGCSATIELVDSQYVDFPYKLSPARPPLVESDDEFYSTSNVPAITAYQGFYPSSVVCMNDIEVYRGDSIANILVSPLKYNYQTETIRAYTLISYKVSFIKENNMIGNFAIQPDMEVEDVYLVNNTLNAHLKLDRVFQSNPSSPQKSYLILSTPTFRASVEKFANWKKLLGFDVQTIFNNSWTPSTIKSTISDCFLNKNNLYYLLIIGDIEDLPSQSFYNNYTQKNYVTDFYYSCLDGDDDQIPDLLYGRIPVKTSAEANVVIDKIINYEKNPTNDSLFYITGLHCAEFQDKNPKNTYEDRRFTLTSEEVRNSIMSEGYDVIRVYAAQNSVNPMFWNNGSYSYGGPIPDELKRPGFTWTGNATDINTAINNGSFYVLHRDHGSVSGWGTPSYLKNNINSLNNGDKLPVVFSINCLTGKFNNNTDCFCEAFLKKENGGCVAIFGATEVSYSGKNDILTEGMFDAIWPSDNLRPTFPGVNNIGGITPTPTYELGQILNQGKARLDEVYRTNTLYTKELFHCFGDPSMKIYTANPTPFTNVDIIRSQDSIYVNLNGDTAAIVFQDQVTEDILCATGTSAALQTNPSTRIRVCISSHNKIPYICDVEPYMVYIQNENVVGPASYNANIIKVGSNVTISKPQGPVVFESGNVRLQAKKILIEGTTTVNKGSSLEIVNE